LAGMYTSGCCRRYLYIDVDAQRGAPTMKKFGRGVEVNGPLRAWPGP